jgi:hypothetical protein
VLVLMQPRRHNSLIAACHTPSELKDSHLNPAASGVFLYPSQNEDADGASKTSEALVTMPSAIANAVQNKGYVQDSIIILCWCWIGPMMRWLIPSPGIDHQNAAMTEATRVTNHPNQEW